MMKEELTREQLEVILSQIRQYEAQHPAAKVSYDVEKRRINIWYPLPADMWQIQKIDIRKNMKDCES